MSDLFFFCAQPYFIVNDTFRCPKENTGEEEEEIADAGYVSPLGGYKAAREKKKGGGERYDFDGFCAWMGNEQVLL